MLDIRKPLGLLFILLGAILFLYGALIQKEVMFFTPDTKFPLKLNQPVGLFMFAFGLVMWQLSRYVNIIRLERGLKAREKELEGRPTSEPEKSAEVSQAKTEEPPSKVAEDEPAKSAESEQPKDAENEQSKDAESEQSKDAENEQSKDST